MPAAVVVLFVFLFFISSCSMLAAESTDEIPLDLQMQIFLKIMTYNRSLDTGKVASFVVTIVFADCDRKELIVEQTINLQRLLNNKTILGRPIQLFTFALNKSFQPSALPNSNLLLIHGRLNAQREAVLNWAKKMKVLTAAAMLDADPEEVVVLLRLEDQKPAIHFNLSLARELGFDFHAQFLKHCIITK